MARVEIPFIIDKIVGGNSQPVSGASVQVNLRGGGAATVYSAESAGVVVGNPLTSDANGRVDGWVEEGSYSLVVSGSGITTYTQEWEAARGRAQAATAQIADNAVTTAKLAANAVTAAQINNGEITLAKLASSLVALLVPTGTVLNYAGTSAPTGFLMADGSEKSRVTYASLFALIGTTYGSGNNSTTFNLPDLRGRATFGPSSGTGRIASNANLGQASGFDRVVLNVSELPSHTHTQNPHAHVKTSEGGDFAALNTGSGFAIGYTGGGNNPIKADGATAGATATNQNTGDDQSHYNMPPYLILNAIIKT